MYFIKKYQDVYLIRLASYCRCTRFNFRMRFYHEKCLSDFHVNASEKKGGFFEPLHDFHQTILQLVVLYLPKHKNTSTWLIIFSNSIIRQTRIIVVFPFLRPIKIGPHESAYTSILMNPSI